MKIYEKFVKRCLDTIFSLILLIVLSPVFLIIAICIAVSSGLPIIYKQERVGKDRKIFKIYKFRTMINNADKQGTSTKENDARITKIGNILRKTSLDELPQLVNVTKGDMSLVGFRPDVLRETDDLTQKKWGTRPGITGAAQVGGRSSLTVSEKHRLEDEYAENITFLNDVRILFKTVTSVIKSTGTN